MSTSIESRVYRILNPLKLFTPCSRWEDAGIKGFRSPPLSENETLLGVYQNYPHSENLCVAFTDKAIHVVTNGQWQCAHYAEIAMIQNPSDSKRNASHCDLITRNGQTYSVPILGGTDRFRDVFQVMRFLDRVVADLISYTNVTSGDPGVTGAKRFPTHE
jgi:hypothetical protein